MPRTTLDIDATVLQELKRRRREEGKTLGRLVSELLASALARDSAEPRPELAWKTKRMGVRVDLEDKEAVEAALGEP